jgi:hypothetical protein
MAGSSTGVSSLETLQKTLERETPGRGKPHLNQRLMAGSSAQVSAVAAPPTGTRRREGSPLGAQPLLLQSCGENQAKKGGGGTAAVRIAV